MTQRDLWFGTRGPRNARIVLVGESWGREEEAAQQPFVGPSGTELNRILSEAGLDPAEIFFTNVISSRPQGNETWRFFETSQNPEAPRHKGLCPSPLVTSELLRLYNQLEAILPTVVIASGNYALWALTNCCSTSSLPTGNGATVRVPGGITSWRGSMLNESLPSGKDLRILPILHPAAILREWYWRAPTVRDLRRVHQALTNDWRGPDITIFAPPSFEQATHHLNTWLQTAESSRLHLACDIETARGCITTIGLAPSKDLAITVPLVQLTEGRGFTNYWSEEQERTLLLLLRRILSHPNIILIGQNFIYDIQYFQQQLSVRPRNYFDTMRAHQLLFPGTPKGLDYLSSLYCHYHWYWKDDGKEWDSKGTLKQHLEYNCLDLVRTYECFEVLAPLIEQAGLSAQWREQCEFNDLALDMMTRGVRIDTSRRAQLSLDLALTAESFQQWFESILPQSDVEATIQLKGKTKTPWYNSPTQQRAFFSALGFKLPLNRKTGRETFGKEGLRTLREKHPEFVRLFDALKDYRSVGVFHNTFVKAPLDPDNRMRCSYGIAETFRWTSSENAFGRGTNLQNIPSGNED